MQILLNEKEYETLKSKADKWDELNLNQLKLTLNQLMLELFKINNVNKEYIKIYFNNVIELLKEK